MLLVFGWAGRVDEAIDGTQLRKTSSSLVLTTITEELCGHEFSASAISQINQQMDEELEKSAQRRLEGEYAYLILDVRYEKVRAFSSTVEPHTNADLPVRDQWRTCRSAFRSGIHSLQGVRNPSRFDHVGEGQGQP